MGKNPGVGAIRESSEARECGRSSPAGREEPRSQLQRKRTRIRIFSPILNQSPSRRVIQNVHDHVLQRFLPAQEVVPEARLPETAFDTMRPGSAQGQILESTHEGDNVAGGGRLDDQMDVVGHYAVAVDSYAGPAGKQTQNIHSSQGDLRIAKDRLAILNRDRYRAYGASLAVFAGIQSNSFAARKERVPLRDR